MSSRVPALHSTHRIAMPNIGKPAGRQNFIARVLHPHIKHVHGGQLPFRHSLCIRSTTTCMLRINGCKYARYVTVCCIGYSRSDLRMERSMCGCSFRESSIALRAPHIGIRCVAQTHRYEFHPCTMLSPNREHHEIRHTGGTACNTVAHWVCSTERNLNAGPFSKLHNF